MCHQAEFKVITFTVSSPKLLQQYSLIFPYFLCTFHKRPAGQNTNKLQSRENNLAFSYFWMSPFLYNTGSSLWVSIGVQAFEIQWHGCILQKKWKLLNLCDQIPKSLFEARLLPAVGKAMAKEEEISRKFPHWYFSPAASLKAGFTPFDAGLGTRQ